MTVALDKQLKEIFLIVLDLPEETNVTALRRISCEKWDSLANVSLIAAIESELSVQLNIEQQDRFTSYESVRLLLDDVM